MMRKQLTNPAGCPLPSTITGPSLQPSPPKMTLPTITYHAHKHTQTHAWKHTSLTGTNLVMHMNTSHIETYTHSYTGTPTVAIGHQRTNLSMLGSEKLIFIPIIWFWVSFSGHSPRDGPCLSVLLKIVQKSLQCMYYTTLFLCISFSVALWRL